MNIEEKAETYHIENYNGSEILHIIEAYKNGYKDANYDLLEFIRVNPKCTNQQITDYLNSL